MMLALPCFLVYWRSRGPIIGKGAGEAKFESAVQLSCVQMVQTAECWFFFISAFALIAGGIVISNNVSDILTAAGNDGNSVNVVANTLYSTGNMLGRLTCMIPSDALVRNGWPRPSILVAMLLLMSTSHAVFLVLPGTGGSEILVALGAFLGGYSFGSIWPHMVVISSEVFGTRELAANYMFYDGTVTCFSELLIGRLLVGSQLDKYAPAGGVCVGAKCFRLTHCVVLGLCAVGIVSAMFLTRKTRAVYAMIFKALNSAKDENRLGE